MEERCTQCLMAEHSRVMPSQTDRPAGRSATGLAAAAAVVLGYSSADLAPVVLVCRHASASTACSRPPSL